MKIGLLVGLLILIGSPSYAQQIKDKIVPLGSDIQSLAVVGSADNAYLTFDFDPTELSDDQTLPCCTKILVTPLPGDAELFTYRLSIVSPLISRFIRIITGVTCTEGGCRTLPILSMLPEAIDGKTYVLQLSREKQPKFHESAYSNSVSFTTTAIPPPPVPVNCVVSEWQEWSPFIAILPVPPATVSTLEIRHRNRTVIIPASNGGAPCPFLTETETRNIIVSPPVKQCMYIPLGGTVNVPKDVGTIIETSRQLITNRFRNNAFLTWGWKVDDYYQIDGNFDHIRITCRGLS